MLGFYGPASALRFSVRQFLHILLWIPMACPPPLRAALVGGRLDSWGSLRVPMASSPIARCTFFGDRLDSYGVDAYGLDSYGCPPDWPWGTHFSVIVRRWVAWICMASPRLDLRVALFVGRLDPYGVDPHGLDPYGFPPTGPRGRTFRWPLGSPWHGPLWPRRSPTAPGIPMAWIPMAWIPMASSQLITLINCAA